METMKAHPIPTLSEKQLASFFAKIAPPDERGCRLWTAATKKCNGYGVFNLHPPRQLLVHRVAYTLWVGPIPDGMEIDHRCHNRRCCTPAHLRPVTHKQNQENRSGAAADCKSGVRGVSKVVTLAGSIRWVAQATNDGNYFHFGNFDTIEEAEAAAVAGRLALFTHNDLDRVPLPALT